jgi:hypothetical protein
MNINRRRRDRPADPRELLRMLEHVELGDVVTVTIDRLALST